MANKHGAQSKGHTKAAGFVSGGPVKPIDPEWEELMKPVKPDKDDMAPDTFSSKGGRGVAKPFGSGKEGDKFSGGGRVK